MMHRAAYRSDAEYAAGSQRPQSGRVDDMRELALQYAQAHREPFLENLFALLRIPSISTLSEYTGYVRAAAEWLAADLKRIGMEHVAVMETAGHPVVYADWLHAGHTAPTVLIYGHYDVQPVDPLERWEMPPFEPMVREGRIYARGATDDKGQMVCHIKALESVLAASDGLPLNVRLLLEGEEEIGSRNLPEFVHTHADLLTADSILVSDTAFLGTGQPLLLYGLRGIVGGEIHLFGPKTDLHSGGYGGTVNNPLHVLARIVSSLHDEEGRVRIPGFYDRVRVLTDAERAALAQVPFTQEKWERETGLRQPWGESGYTLSERIGARPTCEVNGLWGGFQGQGSKTIIPAEAHAKVTMRLVPDQDPHDIGARFVEYVKSQVPADFRVDVPIREGARPLLTPLNSPAMRAAAKAYRDVWGVGPVYALGGGTIGAMAEMQRVLGASVILLGLGLPDTGAHAPNEWFPLEHYQKGIDTVVHTLYNMAQIENRPAVE